MHARPRRFASSFTRRLWRLLHHANTGANSSLFPFLHLPPRSPHSTGFDCTFQADNCEKEN